MLYLGIILQEHTLRHKVYRKHCIHVKTKYGNSLTHTFSDFVLLIIMKKINFIDSRRLWRREGVLSPLPMIQVKLRFVADLFPFSSFSDDKRLLSRSYIFTATAKRE